MEFLKNLFNLTKEESKVMDNVRKKYNLKVHSNDKVLSSDIGIPVLKSELGTNKGNDDVVLLNMIDKTLNMKS